MRGLPIILIGVIGGSTLTFGSYVKTQADDVVVKGDMVTLSKVLTSYSIFNNKYPIDFEELAREEGVSAIGTNYTYQRSADGKEAAVLGVSDSKLYCWNSKAEKIMEVELAHKCQP